MLDVRASWNSETRPSVMACIAKASVDAIAEHPSINATYTERFSVEWGTANLSIAVDTPGGLVTPVVKDAQRLTAEQLMSAVADLAARARRGELVPADMEGGTFTLSNPGAVGPCLRAEALLNPPQVALLGLPGTRRTPIVVGRDDTERVEIRTVIEPSLTFDHRILDGGTAVRYLAGVRDRLQEWGAEDYRRPSDW